ncbi:protein-L-isoaspartate O-methyltransferase [Promethearchaeum syntrophicum]|uniref:Protein-L-isoaspartate O-methyltransferase n=1 Tax=Promethearchaeum syntrophicum TaxID=2594042 RepID=A0A5B9D772_9ARCH|nr:protein-L-isoaspartate O-methyltransferase [Candidatus Prometheoarchaeum syntrophicum]QEE14843.1 Protein-L-isoaspartate O-methyltransferase [Candidatus Prometheoarchaeum syntrophicum]
MKNHKINQERLDLINNLKARKIIITENVYNAMLNVPRHLFLPELDINKAYIDSPQQIGKGQTISAPHMNAMMCEYLEIKPKDKILEIGTGSGYHAAILAELTGKGGIVYTIERIPDLAIKAQKKLEELSYSNVEVIIDDGTLGLESKAPFDKILVTAASPKIPKSLLVQLNPNGGILCIPVGKRHWDQDLIVIQRTKEKYIKKKVCKVIFVPLIGENGFDE